MVDIDVFSISTFNYPCIILYFMSKKLNPASSQEIERVKNWLNLEDPITIVTHQFVDADAAFSAALLRVIRPRASLVFTRADSEISDERMLAVDLSEGTQSVKGLNVGSSFGLILLAIKDIDNPVYNSLKLWAKQLNKTDSGKVCHDNVLLAELITSWKALKLDDNQIVSRAEELIRGKLKHEKRQLEQIKLAQEIEIADNIAVISGDIRVKSSHIFKQGALALIRQSECGQVIQISRELQKQEISLLELSGILPEDWFIHPSGFLACFGSVKAPKNYLDSGIELEELILIVKTWINSHKQNLEEKGIKIGE